MELMQEGSRLTLRGSCSQAFLAHFSNPSNIIGCSSTSVVMHMLISTVQFNGLFNIPSVYPGVLIL